MNLHETQQFDFLLANAVERYTERLEQRNEGPEKALEKLRADPNGEGIWLDEFARAIFRDFLLDNPEGHCCILCSLARRNTPALQPTKVADALAALALHAFSDLLRLKTEELLEQHCAYQAVH